MKPLCGRYGYGDSPGPRPVWLKSLAGFLATSFSFPFSFIALAPGVGMDEALWSVPATYCRVIALTAEFTGVRKVFRARRRATRLLSGIMEEAKFYLECWVDFHASVGVFMSW